jgi:hypothetical protein
MPRWSSSRDFGFVVDGYRRAVDGIRAAARLEVEAAYRGRLEEASADVRRALRTEIEHAIAQRVKTRAIPSRHALF